MDLCQVGLATGADVDDVLCDGAVPIKVSHPGQHLTPLRVVGDGGIEWSIRHLCVQGEGRRYDKGTLESVADGSHGRPEMAVTCNTGRNTQKEKKCKRSMVRGVVIVAITPEQVQPPMTSVQ